MPAVNPNLAQMRKDLSTIRTHWQTSTDRVPFSFTHRIRPDQTLEQYAIDYIQKKGLKD